MEAFGVKHKNLNIRLRSRSGGAFVAISDIILDEGGVVYGCKMETPYRAVHSRAETKEERNAFCGSKYIQSDISEVYLQIEEDLKMDRVVLFSGTPCQVRSIKKYLEVKKIQTDKLITVDIACHGVPSPMIWREYIRYFERDVKGKASSVIFRDKENFGWAAHVDTVNYGKKSVSSELFGFLFNSDHILRPSCHECSCKVLPYDSDITLADFWGIEILDPMFNDNLGVSLVLSNTEKGFCIVSQIKSVCECRKYPVDKTLQKALFESTACPPDRDLFWNDYYAKGFRYCLEKYAHYTKKREVLDRLPLWLAKSIGRKKLVTRRRRCER